MKYYDGRGFGFRVCPCCGVFDTQQALLRLPLRLFLRLPCCVCFLVTLKHIGIELIGLASDILAPGSRSQAYQIPHCSFLCGSF